MDNASGHDSHLAHLVAKDLAVIVATLLLGAMALFAAIVLIDALQLLASESVSMAPIRWG